jgi:hypothetical protein
MTTFPARDLAAASSEPDEHDILQLKGFICGGEIVRFVIHLVAIL